MTAAPLPPRGNEILAAALAYAAKGYRVIPVAEGGKRPHPRLGGDWPTKASNDPAQIRAWWAETPDANIGIVCDEHFGFVLDVDTLDALDYLPELPATLMADTPSGGRHYVFRHPPGIVLDNGNGRLLAYMRTKGWVQNDRAVDIRGARGQIVVAPSLRSDLDGARYAWRYAGQPIAAAPQELIDAILGAAPREPRLRLVEPGDLPADIAREAAVVAAARAGGRGSAIFRASCKLGSAGHTLDTVEAALVPACEANGLVNERGFEHARREIERGWSKGFDSPTKKDAVARERANIRVNGRQLREVIDEAWTIALSTQDMDDDGCPVRLFVRSGALVRLARGDAGLGIEIVNEGGAFGYLLRIANWVKANDFGMAAAKPPKELARDLVTYPHADLARLDAVVSTPVFGFSGELISTPGYHEGSALWFEHGGLEVDVPEVPTPEQVAAARDMILDDLLVDFPFVSDADRAGAVGMLLLPFIRRMVNGVTPIHLIEASSPGSGKGLLAEIVSLIVLGHACEPTTMPEDEDETRKKITSVLMKAAPIVLLDNVREGLDSAQLASALTAERWSDRVLGASRMIDLPNRAVWIATANNPRLSLEIARRCIRIRLAPKTDRPWSRTDFRHVDLRGWVREHRTDLVRACLVLCRAWIANGAPAGDVRLGSFEAWSESVGGVLSAAGVTDFLANAEELYEAADTESQEWRGFVAAWWEDRRTAGRDKTAETAVKSLADLAEKSDPPLLPSVMRGETARGRTQRLAKALIGMRDRVFGEWQIKQAVDPHTKTSRYWLERVEPGGSG